MPRQKAVVALQAERRRGTRRWLLVFAVLALIITLAKTCTLATGHTNPVDQLITATTRSVMWVIKRIGEGLATLPQLPSAMRERNQLRAENALLERRIAETEQLSSENEQLRALLNLRVPAGYIPKSASVVLRPYDLWLESVIIDTGSRDGVRLGNLVVNADGVVGKISEVHGTTSRVQLISSPRFKLGAISGTNRVEGVIQGVDSRTLEFTYPSARFRFEPGEKLFTIGEETEPGGNNNRPRGVYIGNIQGTVEESDGSLSNITVEPAASVSRLGIVVVYTR